MNRIPNSNNLPSNPQKRIMTHHHQCSPLGLAFQQFAQEVFARVVQVGVGLVKEEEVGVAGQGPG